MLIFIISGLVILGYCSLVSTLLLALRHPSFFFLLKYNEMVEYIQLEE